MERPAPRPDIWTLGGPIPFHIKHLSWLQPFEPLDDAFTFSLASGFEKAVGGEPRIPDRRHARLAVNLIVGFEEELIDGIAGDRAVGVALGDSQRVEHHDAIGHGRENRAKTVFPVQPLFHEGDGLLNGDAARARWKQRFNHPQHFVDGRESPKPGSVLMLRPRPHAHSLRRRQEQLVHGDAALVPRHRLECGQHVKRDHDGPRPVGHFRHVERKPFRQQHDLDRHDRSCPPCHHTVKREQDAREDVAHFCAAARQDRLAGA